MIYTQLTQEQRYQIYALLKMGHTQIQIATALGVHKSTINRELRRNRGKQKRHTSCRCRLRIIRPAPPEL
jgi:IS30 family transposase